MRRGVRTSEITRLPTPLDTSNRFFLLQLHDIYDSRKKRLEYRRVVKIDVVRYVTLSASIIQDYGGYV